MLPLDEAVPLPPFDGSLPPLFENLMANSEGYVFLRTIRDGEASCRPRPALRRQQSLLAEPALGLASVKEIAPSAPNLRAARALLPPPHPTPRSAAPQAHFLVNSAFERSIVSVREMHISEAQIRG